MNPESTRRELLAAVGAGAVAVSTSGTVGGLETQPTLADSWPMFGYDLGNTGYNPNAVGPDGDVGAVWTFEITNLRNPFTGSLAVADGTVYVPSPGGDVHALDAETGDQQWSVSVTGALHTSPAIADGRLYIGDDGGTVYAIDLDERAVDWTATTDGAVRTSPAVSSGLVYVGSRGGTAYAFDTENGDELWTADAEAELSASPAVSEDTGLVYIGSDDGRLYAFDAETGSREWAFRTGAGEPIRSAPAVAGGRVYIGAGGSIDQQIYAVDAESGFERWREPVGGAVVTSPAVTENSVYVPVRDGTASRLVAFDPTGDERFTFETGGIPTSPAVAGETVYVGSQNGRVYAIDAQGEATWVVDTQNTVQSAPAVVGEYVFGANSAGTVFALAEGGEALDESGASGTGGDENGGVSPGDFQFLLWPTSAVAFVAAIVGGLYAANRIGVFDRIEAAADAQTPDREELEAARAADAAPTPVWELVVDDVISRAEQTDRTATQNLLVTKYVDSGTLDSPVVAYEIESYRDSPASVQLSEPLLGEHGTGDRTRPLGDNWEVVNDRLVFETTIQPDETARTLVGRPDCSEEQLSELLSRPDISVLER